ncbi:hypothetical protein, partial [Enterococcus faecalis]|uniref:hypothetical protein n=1 Tax=Enterococcus faecalis TaxID=1351 RepID=UPI00163A2B16
PWPALPEAFRRTFLWRLRTRPQGELLAWLHIWRGLGSASQGPALALPATLCALAPDAHGRAALALTLAPVRQMVFLNALLKQHTYLLAPGSLRLDQLADIDALDAEDEHFSAYHDAVLGNLQRTVSVAYTLQGCSIASQRTYACRPNEFRYSLA